MLGQTIAEDHGKITDIRVLPSEGTASRVEVSFQASGNVLGVQCTELGTYESWPSEGGVMHGKGQGLIMTPDGDSVSWTGEGVGKPTGKGLGASWRGALFYQTTSKRLEHLNGVTGVFEYEVDETGNTTSKVTEWT